MKLEHEHYIDHGWEQIPEELMNNEYNALTWLLEFDICIYPGLNSREFHIVEIDPDLTIQYDKKQPRRFSIKELYFHK